MPKVHHFPDHDKARSFADQEPRDPFGTLSDEEFAQLVDERHRLDEMKAQAAEEYAAWADEMDETLTDNELRVLALEAGDPTAATDTGAITCPHCGCPDGFIHTDEDGSEFVCPDCHGYELSSHGPATADLVRSARLYEVLRFPEAIPQFSADHTAHSLALSMEAC